MPDKQTRRNGVGCRGTPGPGRPKGSPNKATADVRAAIAAFAEANVGKLQEWLDRIAEDEPARAADLFVRVLEYHIPKLGRTELANPDGSPLNFTLTVPPKNETLGPDAAAG